MGDTVTVADVLARKKPVTVTVPIVLDPALAERHADLKNEVENARMLLEAQGDHPSPHRADRFEEAVAALDALEAEMSESDGVVEFVFRSIGRTAYDALLDAHPPTPDQVKKAQKDAANPKARPRWNPDTFPTAIISAAAVSPAMTEADVKALANSEDWNDAEFSALLLGAIQANETHRVVDWGKGSRTT